MMRSLYVRVVFTFLLAVIIGLTVAYISTWMIFQKQLAAEIHEETMSVSNDLIDIYVQTANQGMEPLRSYVHALRDYSIRIIGHGGDVLVLNAKHTKSEITVTTEEAERVLGGETVVTTEERAEVIGRPFELNGDAYALFVMPVDNNGFSLAKILTTFLLIMFVVGSIIFLIASRYLVRPIRQMTNATEQMASGDFGVELNLGRKDELGALARSFDLMAQELKQIEQMRQDFVSNVSHEIQSPLTSITGFAKALRDGVVSSENQTRYLGIIADESERLSRLSSNLLQLASLESEHHPFDPVLYALDEQLRKVVVSLEPQWSSKHINFELDLPAVQIDADPDQLNQVWLNLLGNAIKFTPEDGKVSIGLSSDANEIEVTVADSGIGISPEDAKYIFERFYKADRSRHRTCQGSGLGLAIVRKIVELHNGRIFIAGSSPGGGTVIKVILPMGDRNVSTA
ncbi:sensor histidine kinase [Paenibacillus lutimineralis]|uniref:Heme sensor protein HssS n=1 Tax=Paenibacillus lutimineralis TaxID=2707005 RepID=A0A3S9UTY1_9BACL|nr:HAMP domain-containing sensor histidine kinase [Paenibacillus lutimineralis]AZS13734.1 sensor histidine kinase [Paenibacillus lutimineralis]